MRITVDACYNACIELKTSQHGTDHQTDKRTHVLQCIR